MRGLWSAVGTGFGDAVRAGDGSGVGVVAGRWFVGERRGRAGRPIAALLGPHAVFSAEALEGSPAGSQSQIEAEVLGAARGSPPDGEDSLVHPDEVMERTEGDEVVVRVAASATGENDVVPLQGSPRAAAGDRATPVVAVEHRGFPARAGAFELGPGAAGVMAEDDQRAPALADSVALAQGLGLDFGDELGQEARGVLVEDPLETYTAFPG
jgi:hypothetical protein